MFIFGLILSVTDRERVLAENLERACHQCVRTTPHRLVEIYRQLALFFIPVWRWNRRHSLVCQDCGRAEPCSPEETSNVSGG